MSDQGFRDFHRIVKTKPPTRIDSMSNKAKGNPPPDDPVQRAV